MKQISKLLFMLLFIPSFFYAVFVGNDVLFDKFGKVGASFNYTYSPKKAVVSQVDTSKLSPATSVPMLIYHGVVRKIDTENTLVEKFIEQMEFLKREGYETITLKDFEEFRKGNLTLPPKPIIITFDDGRKDSFYPVDPILEKLGFKATLFLATGNANSGDSFYLSWEELTEAYESGRWDIQAHGRNSHKRIKIDSVGTQGYYLSSRLYIDGQGLENIEDYEKRVEEDYIQGIQDIQDHLGYRPKYYAKPLEDYGANPINNYDQGYDFNESLVQKYFKFAFRQANDSEDLYKFLASPYNFADDNPHTLARIQVKNLDAATLKKFLEDNLPTVPSLHLSGGDPVSFENAAGALYGELTFDEKGLHLYSNKTHKSARVTLGADYWSEYTIEAKVQKLKGRSVALIGYLKNKNYISVGITDHTLFIREAIDGLETDLETPIDIAGYEKNKNTFRIKFQDQTVSVYFNDILIFNKISIGVSKGQIGFKVWDPVVKAESILYNLNVYPTDDQSLIN